METHLTSASTAIPKVSVLMTCYNAASTIQESVNSIIAQTFNNWELVVVDNCSTDISLTVVKNLNDDRIRIIALDKNHGRTPALAIALENARADFVAILDADDISSQDRLQQQFDFLTNNPNIIVVGSWYRNIDQHGNLINEVRTPTTSVDVMRQMASDNPIVNSSAMFRAESARAVGGYNQKYLYAQDFALWLALASIGELAILPKFLTDIRRVTSSLSSISSNSLILTADNYELYRKAQNLSGLTLLDKLHGKRTVGLYGLLYAWRSLQARKFVRALGLLIQNLWALPLVAFELLRKGFNSLKSI
ncbi:MAG: glycosyltransferase [Actinobacteria bacterium]|nr:glycosyltransferase [Actinomycetota bacterium]